MALHPKTKKRPAIHVGKDDFTGIVGFDPVNEDEAKARGGNGSTTVEMADGKWQAARHHHPAGEALQKVLDDSLNAKAQSLGFKEAIPTQWRNASLEEALELRANGITVVIRAGLVLVPVSTSKRNH